MIETLIWINVWGGVGEGEGVKAWMVYGLASFRRVGPEVLIPLLGCEGVLVGKSGTECVLANKKG